MTRPNLRIVVSEAIAPEALPVLEAVASVHYDPALHQRRDELMGLLRDADALIVRNATRVNAELLTDAARLRVVGRLGVGLDNVERAALRARGVRLTWAPGTNAASVAEYVMAAALHFARDLSRVSAKTRAGGWDRQGGIGGELLGKRLGVVGLGDIGSRLARRAQAFGMEVVAHDPALHGGSFAVQELGVRLLDLGELLERSDIVSLHVPLTEGTRHLLNAGHLARLKPSAVLINTARGGLIDEAALAAALRAGRLAGAALDVREEEPPAPPDLLADAPNLLLTPHIAGVTRESNLRASLHVAWDVRRVLSGEAPLSPVPEG